MNSVVELASTNLPTAYGTFRLVVFRDEQTNKEHMALVYGTPRANQKILTRVHSQCQTSESFLSLKCDCQWQLHKAMETIAAEGAGIIVYLQEEGRGIGLVNKIKAYQLQEAGLNTIEANHALGLQSDYRDYHVAYAILKSLSISQIRLLTNNPEKIDRLRSYGIDVVERVALEAEASEINRSYFQVKKEKMGHLLNTV